MRDRNKNTNDFGNREGFHEMTNRNDRGDRSSYDDGMSRSEKNDYRPAGSTYGSRGSQYDESSSYSGSDYDYNRSGYRGDSSGFSGQNRHPYGGQQANRADNDRSQYGQQQPDWQRASSRDNMSRFDQDYSTRRALEDREIGVNSGYRDSGSGFSTNERSPGQHFGKGPKGYRRSDERIKEEVCEALERHHDIDASEVEIEVNEGLVTLSGSVESRQTKRMVEDVVEGLTGVSDIRNELRISSSETHRSKMMSPFDSTKTDSMDSARTSSGPSGKSSPARSTSSSPSTGSGKSVQ